MVLTNKREAQLKKMPLMETRLTKSKDGKYLVHRTIITSIRPMAYYAAIVNNAESVQVDELDAQEIAQAAEA